MVVAHARKVLDAAAADQHHRVLLQVVAFAANVTRDFEAVGQAYARDLAQRRIRLFSGSSCRRACKRRVFCGEFLSAGTLLFTVRMTRGLRTNWLIVGMVGYLLPAVFR